MDTRPVRRPAMSRVSALAASLLFTLACSSSTENSTSAVDDVGASALDSDVDASATSDVGGSVDVGSDTKSGDAAPSEVGDASGSDGGACGKRDQACCGGATCESGLVCGGGTCACDTSLCDRFGYVCDGNKQTACGPTAPGSCYVKISARDCPADLPCNPTTGTCGGCDAHDLCAGKADGTFLGCMPYVAQWCRKGADGCVTTVNETCGLSCVGGSRNGCCGGDGQMCCSPPGAACATGLTCTSGTCKT